MNGKTREDRVKTVFGGGGQVVILGAGASIAATKRNPELSGKQLPSMDNFIQLVGPRRRASLACASFSCGFQLP